MFSKYLKHTYVYKNMLLLFNLNCMFLIITYALKNSHILQRGCFMAVIEVWWFLLTRVFLQVRKHDNFFQLY